MKKTLIFIAMLLVIFTFSTTEVSADERYEEYDGREYYSSYTGTTLAGDEWTVRVWISDTYFTGTPFFIRYETEGIEFSALSLQGNYYELDSPYIKHNENRGMIIITNRYFFDKLYTGGDYYDMYNDNHFLYGAIIFTTENRRATYVKMMFIGISKFQDDWQHKYDAYVHSIERENRR